MMVFRVVWPKLLGLAKAVVMENSQRKGVFYCVGVGERTPSAVKNRGPRSGGLAGVKTESLGAVNNRPILPDINNCHATAQLLRLDGQKTRRRSQS